MSDSDPTVVIPDPEAEVEPQAPPPATPETPKSETLTSEQIQAKMAREKAEGERAALRKLSEETGKTIEELKDLAKSDQEEKEARKTDLDKLREAHEALTKAKEVETSELQLKNHTLAVKLQLSQAGLALPEDAVEAKQALDRVVGLITAPIGAEDDEIASNIEGLKKQFPALFQAVPQTPVGNPPSNPSGTPRQPSLGNANADFGKQMAAKANAQRGVVIPTA